MGLPYSKQIHAAFSQSQIMMQRLQTEVTPLVEAGYPIIASTLSVLKTTRNIAVLLACVQVYTAIMLTVQFVVLGMVLVCVDEDLEVERRRLVTPAVSRTLEWGERWAGWWVWGMKVVVVGGVAGVGFMGWAGREVEGGGERGEEMEDKDNDSVGDRAEDGEADESNNEQEGEFDHAPDDMDGVER